MRCVKWQQNVYRQSEKGVGEQQERTSKHCGVTTLTCGEPTEHQTSHGRNMEMEEGQAEVRN